MSIVEARRAHSEQAAGVEIGRLWLDVDTAD